MHPMSDEPIPEPDGMEDDAAWPAGHRTYSEQAAVERAAYRERLAAFGREFGVTPAKWSTHNLARLLRRTGERPDRIAAARALLDALGMGWGGRHWSSDWWVFDHGEMWCRRGQPVMVTGAPYDLDDQERELLAVLARWSPALRVTVNDRPSPYGWGTHHVRVELATVQSSRRTCTSRRST
jgi:hypothetical protein